MTPPPWRSNGFPTELPLSLLLFILVWMKMFILNWVNNHFVLFIIQKHYTNLTSHSSTETHLCDCCNLIDTLYLMLTATAARGNRCYSKRQTLVYRLFQINFTRSEGPGRAGASVSGLAPDTRYALRMASFNDVGGSPYTSPLHFTTREEGQLTINENLCLKYIIMSVLRTPFMH